MAKPLEIESPAEEGSVDWNAAEEFLTGKTGPDGDGEETTEENPEFKVFSYKGKKLRVSAAEYEVLEDLRKQARGENGRLGSELAQTRERLARLEGQIAASQPAKEEEEELTPPDPKLAISNFAAWQQQNEAYHNAKMERFAARLEAKYANDQQTREQAAQKEQRDRQWADTFYASFDHLDNPAIKPIVSQVYIENRAEIDGLSTAEAHERLAELADERLLTLKNAGKQVKQNNRPPRLETSASGTPRTKHDAAPRVVTAASWSAKERARMRGEALK